MELHELLEVGLRLVRGNNGRERESCLIMFSIFSLLRVKLLALHKSAKTQWPNFNPNHRHKKMPTANNMSSTTSSNSWYHNSQK